MVHYQRVGAVPPKRHIQHRDPAGNLYFEELMGEEGFSSDSSLLYHRHVPSAMLEARVWALPNQATTPNHPLIPRHLTVHDLWTGEVWKDTDAVTGRRLVLGNGDVRISYAVCGKPSPFYRNGIGDECVFVEAGTATVETVFGSLDVRDGDYVILPRATTHRWVPVGDEPLRLYVIEGNNHIAPPKRYLSRYGQLLEHAPYCERDLRVPAGPLLADDSGPTEVFIKHRGHGVGGMAGTVHVVPNHPFDVVGWDGCLYHQVFEGQNFVICNFVPRKVDYHPLSIPVPYYHSNVDSDEVMFYVAGNYEARKGSGIGLGSISLHPGGHSHGPQPAAYEQSIGVEYFDELAVMVDTFRPLELGEAGCAVDDGVYLTSWVRGQQ
jgi:homogentisate 1,2-dioxygenase